MVEVDPNDAGFQNPTKFVGPVYDKAEAEALAKEKGWTVKQDGDKWRRVVPSPAPKRIFEMRPIKWLLEHGTIVICAGGGGIPTMYEPGKQRKLVGVEAVIDKDFCSELLAREVDADLLVMATDTEAVFVNWGSPQAKRIFKASPAAISELSFPAGSMGPKVDAACRFAVATGKTAAIGALADLPGILQGEKGTLIGRAFEGISYHA
jgi:carbamate kinase